jgi:hypothetical protein
LFSVPGLCGNRCCRRNLRIDISIRIAICVGFTISVEFIGHLGTRNSGPSLRRSIVTRSRRRVGERRSRIIGRQIQPRLLPRRFFRVLPRESLLILYLHTSVDGGDTTVGYR